MSGALGKFPTRTCHPFKFLSETRCPNTRRPTTVTTRPNRHATTGLFAHETRCRNRCCAVLCHMEGRDRTRLPRPAPATRCRPQRCSSGRPCMPRAHYALCGGTIIAAVHGQVRTSSTSSAWLQTQAASECVKSGHPTGNGAGAFKGKRADHSF